MQIEVAQVYFSEHLVSLAGKANSNCSRLGLQILGKPSPEEWELCDGKGINLSAQMQGREKKNTFYWFSSPMHLFWIKFIFFSRNNKDCSLHLSTVTFQLQAGTMRSASSDYFHLLFILHSLPSHKFFLNVIVINFSINNFCKLQKLLWHCRGCDELQKYHGRCYLLLLLWAQVLL